MSTVTYVQATYRLFLVEKNRNWRPEEHKNGCKLFPTTQEEPTTIHILQIYVVVCMCGSPFKTQYKREKHSHVYYLQQRSTCLDCSAYWVGTLRPQNQTGIN
jgi:hypothetical protein